MAALDVIKRIENKDFVKKAIYEKEKCNVSQKFKEAFDKSEYVDETQNRKGPKKSQKMLVTEIAADDHGSQLNFFKEGSD